MAAKPYKNRGLAGTQLNQSDAERVKAKINTSKIVSRLQACANGEITMTSDSIAAAKLLLERTIPSLSATEVKQQNTNYVARLPSPAANADTWIASVSPTEALGRAEGEDQSPSKAKH